jgi:hypothetical protein
MRKQREEIFNGNYTYIKIFIRILKVTNVKSMLKLSLFKRKEIPQKFEGLHILFIDNKL